MPVIAIRPDMDPQPDPAAQKGGRGVGWKRQEKGRRLDGGQEATEESGSGNNIFDYPIRLGKGGMGWDTMMLMERNQFSLSRAMAHASPPAGDTALRSEDYSRARG